DGHDARQSANRNDGVDAALAKQFDRPQSHSLLGGRPAAQQCRLHDRQCFLRRFAMTEFRMTDDMVLALSKWTAEKIAEAVAPLKRRIAELETKQVELANWKYLGIWTTGFYHRGNFVTFDGSLWTCLADTHARPGEDPRGWQLCVKRG